MSSRPPAIGCTARRGHDIEFAFAGGRALPAAAEADHAWLTTEVAPGTTRGLVAACLAASLMPLNSTMIAVAVPDIAEHVDTPPGTVTQALVATYLVAAIALQSPGGKLGDRIGQWRAFGFGQALLAVGRDRRLPGADAVAADRVARADGGRRRDRRARHGRPSAHRAARASTRACLRHLRLGHVARRRHRSLGGRRACPVVRLAEHLPGQPPDPALSAVLAASAHHEPTPRRPHTVRLGRFGAACRRAGVPGAGGRGAGGVRAAARGLPASPCWCRSSSSSGGLPIRSSRSGCSATFGSRRARW